MFKRVLPAEEYAEIRWDQLEAGDVNFIKDFYYRLAHRVGELSHLADGSYAIAERWNLGEEYWGYAKNKLWSRLAIRFTMPMKRQRRSVPLLTVCSTVTA